MSYTTTSKWMTRREVERNIKTGVYLQTQHESHKSPATWHKIDSMMSIPSGSFQYHVCINNEWKYITAAVVIGFHTQESLNKCIINELIESGADASIIEQIKLSMK